MVSLSTGGASSSGPALIGVPGTASSQQSFEEFQTAPSFVRNTAFNIGASILSLTVGLVLAPVLLAALGLERFGLWSLLWAITGSLGLLDLRLAAATTPLAATAWARQERGRVRCLVSTGLAFYAALGLLEIGAALIWTRLPGLMDWIPAPLKDEGCFALVAAVGVFALSSVTSVFTGLLHGLNRFDLAARITMAVTIIRGAVLVAVAWGGGGLRALLLAEGVVACAQCAVTVQVARRVVPDLRFLHAPDAGILRELVAFGGKLQIAHAAHLVSLHADKLLLSAFLGLSAVAYYELGQKIVYSMRGLPLLLISATMPVVSTMEARGERERLWRLYVACTRAVVFVGTPLLVFTVSGAEAILLAWAGVSALEARQAVWLLSLGYYAYLVSVMAGVTSVGMGKPELEMRRCLLAGALNLALSASLIPLMGLAGAPLGTALSLAAGAWYLTRRLSAEFGYPASSIIGILRWPAVVALPAAGGAMLILSVANGGRGMATVGLAASALLIGAVFFWLGIRDGLLNGNWLRAVPVRLKLRGIFP